MKNQLSNPVKYNKIIVIEALFMTIALHGLLFFSFGSQTLSDQTAENRKATITLYNLSKMSADELAKFKSYCAFNDPSMFTGTTNANGYVGFFNKKSKIEFENYKINNKNSSGKYVAEYQKNKLSEVSLAEAQTYSKTIDNFDNMYSVNTQKRELKYPLAIGSDGSEIPLIISREEEQLLARHKLGNTIIRVNYDDDGILKLNIMQSSGQRNFDILSCRLLYSQLQSAGKSKTPFYTVYYQEELP